MVSSSVLHDNLGLDILLLGPNGQLGWQLRRSLACLGRVHARDRHSGGDLSDEQALRRTIEEIQPSIIVNAAAYTAVDRAQIQHEAAHQINAQAPLLLSRLAAAMGAALVHFSSDYVFDGHGQTPWRESDTCAPLSIYGQTKLGGDRAIEQVLGQGLGSGGRGYLILRTSWVYGARGANFIATILRLALQQERLTVVCDQWGAPTGAELLADVTSLAIRALLANPQLAGLYHVAASGVTSWWEYARHIVEFARASHPHLEWKVRSIDPIKSSDWPVAATRPLNSRLDTSKFCQAFDVYLPHWQEGVDRVLSQWGAGNWVP